MIFELPLVFLLTPPPLEPDPEVPGVRNEGDGLTPTLELSATLHGLSLDEIFGLRSSSADGPPELENEGGGVNKNASGIGESS